MRRDCGRTRGANLRATIAWASAFGACVMWGLLSASAQQVPSGADALQALQQLRGQGQQPSGQGVTPQQIILEPNAPRNPQLPTSRLEQLQSTRAGVKLTQFGYDQLGVGRSVTLPQMGAVQDSYVLGPGDEIVVSLRGQENSEYRATVDRDGRVVLPRLAPISASGRTLGDFRRDLVAAVHRSYVATDGFVTIGRVRQVSVLVSGEVNSPGVRILTGLSSPVDALLVSGGVKKTGSLRNVYVLRGGRRISVDLYNVLTGHGAQSTLSLADGDKVVVPALGPTVAVVGWVRRPGIYEIAGGRASMSVRETLALAGGLEVRGKYRISLLRVASDGRNEMVSLNGQAGSIGDSDILFVQPAASQTTDMATLSGATPLAGQYSTRNTKLSEIVKSPGALGANPYTLVGIISRRDPVTLLRTLVPFTPVAVLKGAEDMNIQSDDIVRFISVKEARMLSGTLRRYMSLRQTSEEAMRNPQAPSLDSASQASQGNQQMFLPQSSQQTNTAANGRSPYQTIPSMPQPLSPPEADRQALFQAERDQELGEKIENGTIRSRPYPVLGQGVNQQQNQSLSPDLQAQQQLYQNDNQYQYQSPDTQDQLQQLYGVDDSQNRSPYQAHPGLILPLAQQGNQQPLPPNLQEGAASPGQTSTNKEVTRLSQVANQLGVDPIVLANFLEDHSVNVDGAVQGPGIYLVGASADIQSLLAAAGGLARWADRGAVEVISTAVDPNTGMARTNRRSVSLAGGVDAGYIVSPRDQVRVNEVYTAAGVGSVTLQGEVRRVGTYQIVRGEHLSDVLARAGGLTQSAYPYGTVFLRRSVAERERTAFQREAQEIENQLLLAMSRRDPNAKLSPDAFTALQGYVNQIRNQRPLGRVTVAADPAVLASNPAQDPLLEPGDVVYVPPRPYSVSVLGEVLQPGSVPFKPDLAAGDYVELAGGYSRFADTSETILVLPDGSARRVSSSWFQLNEDDIPPGSTIFVARDISGIDTHQIIIDVTSIFSQLAVSAASLAVISQNLGK